MKLTPAERWILANQYRILERLEPKKKDEHKDARTVMENGYELDYDELSGIKEPPKTMSEAECKKVHDIADMFLALKRAYRQLDEDTKAELTEEAVAFVGFSDRREIKYMEYARLSYASRGFPGFDLSDDFGDWERPTYLDIYERMLAAWRKSGASPNPTEEDLTRIVAARDATEEPCT